MTSRMTLVAYRLLLTLTVKLSLSFADEIWGTAGSSLATCEMVREEQKRAGRRFFALSDGCSDFSLSRAQWWRITTKACVAYQTARRRVHPLRLRNCNSPVNVLDAGPTSPREELLSDDERDRRSRPAPMRSSARSQVSHIVAR